MEKLLRFFRTKEFYLGLLIVLAVLIGLYFRLYHIDFGLPHSFHADEPEISEPAIKHTYELREIIKNNNYYKLIPISYVYGTFPTYLFTLFTIVFSKANSFLNQPINKTDIFVFQRNINALLSLIIIFASSLLYYKLFKDKFGTLLTAFLTALNWKLIVHAHYLNPDTVVTTLLIAACLTAIYYYDKKRNLFTLLTGILLGLAIGTKITAVITLPLFMYAFVSKKDYKSLAAFLFIIFGTFILSNPFSFIFFKDFIYRMYLLQFRENGLVFDSADLSPFKYIAALAYIVTPMILAVSLYGKVVAAISKTGDAKEVKQNLFPHILLIGHIAIYLLFFSLSSRRVDRWVLPIIPITLIYASYGFAILKNKLGKFQFGVLLTIFLITYLVFPILLLFEFKRDTPKSAAYLWMQKNTSSLETKYIISEEGLDPMNKLPLSKVDQYEVYESKGAQFFIPQNPLQYNYVVLSSRPMENFKKPLIKKLFPAYAQKWVDFENTILDTNKFELVKEFSGPKPNLTEVSDVFIYKKIL